MQKAIAEVAKKHLAEGGALLIRMYTDTALLMNACDVSARSYEARTDDFQLSTVGNIPANVRLPKEIDVVFHRNQLPPSYRGRALKRISEDFVIRMISTTDGILEDIYEESLPLIESDITEKKVSQRVRSSWAMANGHAELVNFLIDKAGLMSPPGNTSTIQMVFDRYYEIREIRHALVHTGGVLTPKHLANLSDFSSRLPPESQRYSLANAPFIASGSVVLTGPEILALRHWAYTTVFDYLQRAIDASVRA